MGNLEAEFTQFKITHSGNIEQLKDKAVQQDNILKVQKNDPERPGGRLGKHSRTTK